MPREAMGPGGPIPPGGRLPPREPGYQPPPSQGQHHGGGAGRHAGGPGYAAPGGRRPGVQGHAGPAGPAEAADQFDGGYAYVIRPSDNPVRPAAPTRPPSFGRSADPARPADPVRSPEPDVYVYRDIEDQPDDPAAAAPAPDEHDASYWYDLPGTAAQGDATPRLPQETRGPFEPLVSSADLPGTTPRFSASLDDAEPDAPEAASSRQVPGAAGDEGLQDTAHAHARKLEQIKDLYLTAEAIGEANADKHFDHLLARQRELIGEYFKQSSAAKPAAGPADQAGAEPAGAAGQEAGDPGNAAPAGGAAGTAEGARVTADQPRAW